LNSSLTRIFKDAWHLLSDVPGWTEPPLNLRIRRLIPIILPVCLILLLLGWSRLVRQTQIDAEYASYAPLVTLENDVNQLRIAYSKQRTEELAARATEASQTLLPSTEAAPEYLQGLRKTVTQYGWVATFKDYEPVSGSSDQENLIRFVPAAGKMIPAPENREPFASLLELLAHLTTSSQRTDLTRLAVHVDDKKRPTVEMNFQIASHPNHEKAPQ